MNIGVIGAGSWGTTLAVHLAALGHDVRLWAFGEKQRAHLREDRRNRRYLPAVEFPPTLTVVEKTIEAADAEVVVIATPTQFIRETLAPVPPGNLAGRLIVSASKGIERGSLLRVSELLQQTHGIDPASFVCLSGPSHAEEVSQGIPTAIVAAGPSVGSAEIIQSLFNCNTLRVYSSEDLAGVELGGALKNVIALCAGISDGLGFGDNSKAALITRGLAEITRLGTALGADAQTFSGLSGLGDLVVTCTSRHSRNRYVGEQIGRGRRLDDVIDEMNMVAEGVTTAESGYQLSQKVGVEMPIFEAVNQVLFENKDPHRATFELMTREMKGEHEGT